LSVAERRQPFTLFLRFACARQLVRCVSPVGHVAPAQLHDVLSDWETQSPIARLASIADADASG
jgi:hypothetical protein